MSGEQKRFDALMKRIIRVSPEELKRRLAAKKAVKKTLAKPAEKSLPNS
jgi:hypothetical protein